MKKFLVPLLLLAQTTLYAQHGGVMNNWHFGWFASLEFTTGSPVATSGSVLISYEGCVSYSDDQGNLLFYSNGGSNDGAMFPAPGGVWNKNHQLMPNGAFNNTMGSMSAAQSTLVIPKSATEYYLFTMGAGDGKDLRYCMIDMTLDGGLGDVTDMGTILLEGPGIDLDEGLTATHHANGTDYWLTVRDGSEFRTYLVSSSGITGPTVQNIGTSGGSSLKFSVQGDKMLTSQELFDFDNATGVFSNPFLFQTQDFGHAFSPSGQYVYRRAVAESTIKQYDLNAANILGSEQIIASGLSMFAGSMQIGPDMKLYVSNMDQPKLSVINDPDVAGVACNFVVDQIDLGGMDCKLGLPNFVDSELIQDHNSIEELEEVQVQVYPNPSTGVISINAPEETFIESVQVLNLSGQVIDVLPFEEQLNLNFESGTYILVFQSADGTISRSRVIVR